MNEQKFLYQIGDPLQDNFVYLNSLEGSNFDIAKGIKSRRSENAFIDGFNDNYRFQKSFLEGWTLTCNITRNIDTDWNYLQKMKRLKLKLFFIEVPLTPSGKYKIYYTYGRYLSGLPDFYSAGGGIEAGSGNIQYQSIPLTFEVQQPFYYLTDEDLILLNHEAVGNFLVWGDSSITFGDAGVDYGVNNPNYEVAFNSLSRQEQNDYIDLCYPKYQFSFADKFIKNQPHPESFTINTNNSFSTTLTTNNVLITDSSNLDLQTTEESYFNLIKLDITGGFATGEWVEIQNLSTNTGFRFTWGANNNSSASLLINTAQTSNKLVDLVLGAVVQQADSAGNIVYNYSVLEGSFQPLAFSNLLKPETDKASRFNLPFGTTDSLQIQKSTTNNLTVTIKNLKTFS